ncbi:hypothetical protein [Geomicrobium sp. JCM 19055]|uniref:hypothetical protein n=1 Tax=Geomicrobium sp. JCM 19055 TaxID=1460649 RepID=UPI00045ED0D2|nr:hypothetical protein [Geomicrobium sp. JCM 19055]GAK01502.1 hypothetical protein JCM19055_4674 [Geomicrobium sp. JCM 19055]
MGLAGFQRKRRKEAEERAKAEQRNQEGQKVKTEQEGKGKKTEEQPKKFEEMTVAQLQAYAEEKKLAYTKSMKKR